MNNLQVKDCMSKLIKLSKSNFFGTNFELNDEWEKAYEYAIRPMEYELFDDTISAALAKHNYLPKPADLKKAYGEVKIQNNQEIAEMKHFDDCPLCENRGVFTYTKDNCEYVARCVCARGQKYINAPSIDRIFDLNSLNKEVENSKIIPPDAGDGYEPKKVSIQDILRTRNYTESGNVPVFG